MVERTYPIEPIGAVRSELSQLDAAPLQGRQYAAHFKAANITRTRHDDALQRLAGGRCLGFGFFRGLPAHRFFSVSLDRYGAQNFVYKNDSEETLQPPDPSNTFNRLIARDIQREPAAFFLASAM